MKVKLTVKRITILIISLILLVLIVYKLSYKPITKINYFGRIFEFRDDIKLAKKVRATPDEKAIHNLFWNESLKRITIVFKPIESQTGYYAVEAFELSNKLSLMYLLNGRKIGFESENVTSYENITSNQNELKIILIHPLLTNKTLIEAKDNLVFVFARNERDFDLATIKLILIAMGVKV